MRDTVKDGQVLKLLSGNEALALGAYHAGVKIAAAYPGTPSTEILEAIAGVGDIYAEWSTNEKVAMEVAMGAAYAGVRSLAIMKQVGLNVASDPFMAAAITGINAGLVVISADDPGIHSSQSEQDNRYYAKFAKVPMLEPGDSQEAYALMAYAFDISERFDTPVIVRSTTRISHSKSVVRVKTSHLASVTEARFKRDVSKYVMLPVNARFRRPLIEERLDKLADFSETFPANELIWGERHLGIVTSGVAYQYAREVFPKASFLKLSMTYPLPVELLRNFAGQVEKVLVIEELEPFIEEHMTLMGISVIGKECIPRVGELNPDIIEEAGRRYGLLARTSPHPLVTETVLPKRPPLLCPGCPHAGLFFVLSSLGKRNSLKRSESPEKSDLIITGDIGCYTLGAYPPLNAMDTCACMGASIGQALGMEKAGVSNRVVAIIGDSTFMHSGITGLVNGIYNGGQITVIILDNHTTAMTGHQEHPGTGVTAQRLETREVDLESLVRGIGVQDVKVIDAFNLKDIRAGVKNSLGNRELSVIIVRGDCPVRTRQRTEVRSVEAEKCNECGICLLIGCHAIQSENGKISIDGTLCVGDICGICQQLCPRRAIVALSEIKGGEPR